MAKTKAQTQAQTQQPPAQSTQAQDAGEPAWFAAFVKSREIADKLAREESAKSHADTLASLQSQFQVALKAQQDEIDTLKNLRRTSNVERGPDASMPHSTPTTKMSVPSQAVGEYAYF